jgi:hypothetical protein
MKAIVFEGKRPLQWDGQAWVPVHPATAQQWLDADEAHVFLSRRWATALRFIPAELSPSHAQWLHCLHDWVRIGKWGHWQRFADGYRYRCRKCGGYRREFPGYRREFEPEGPPEELLVPAVKVLPWATWLRPLQACGHQWVALATKSPRRQAGYRWFCHLCGGYRK